MAKPNTRRLEASLMIAELFAYARGRDIPMKLIAEKADINYNQLSAIKVGRVANPSFDTVIAIADAIDIKLKW